MKDLVKRRNLFCTNVEMVTLHSPEIFAYNKAENAVNFLHSLSKQARANGFSVNSDEIRYSCREGLTIAASSEEQKTMVAFSWRFNRPVNESEADYEVKANRCEN